MVQVETKSEEQIHKSKALTFSDSAT